jgi:hypothetical protein
MVDYSKFDNIVLSSDEEDENERQNLEGNFENNDLVPIIFADIKQIPEVTDTNKYHSDSVFTSPPPQPSIFCLDKIL